MRANIRIVVIFLLVIHLVAVIKGI